MSKKKVLNKAEQHQLLKGQAMPEVKILIKKYGRTVIQGCLNQLRDYEKKLKQLSNLRREASRLQREIK